MIKSIKSSFQILFSFLNYKDIKVFVKIFSAHPPFLQIVLWYFSCILLKIKKCGFFEPIRHDKICQSQFSDLL
jgi:hypothetical protein